MHPGSSYLLFMSALLMVFYSIHFFSLSITMLPTPPSVPLPFICPFSLLSCYPHSKKISLKKSLKTFPRKDLCSTAASQQANLNSNLLSPMVIAGWPTWNLKFPFLALLPGCWYYLPLNQQQNHQSSEVCPLKNSLLILPAKTGTAHKEEARETGLFTAAILMTTILCILLGPLRERSTRFRQYKIQK